MEKDISNLSDEELLNITEKDLISEEEETKEEKEENLENNQEVKDNSSTEETQEENDSEESSEVNKEEEEEDESNLESQEVDENTKNIEDSEEDTKKEEGTLKTTTKKVDNTNENIESDKDSKNPKNKSNIDYEGFYKKVMAPLKANGKTIQLRSPEEAIQLMQMGLNYTKKMQSIAPHRKTLLMLEQNNLLDEDKLSFLIDLDKKNPEAIKKLLKDSNLDPLDLDTSTESTYKPTNRRITDKEVSFVSVLDELKQSKEGLETLGEINSNWDEGSKELLWDSPEIMQTINDQRNNGVYKIITDEMEHMRVLGQLPTNQPFLQTYLQVGNMLMSKAKVNSQPIATKAAMPKTVVKNNAKAKAAGITNTGNKTVKKFINPLEMSDEEFLKLSKF